MQELQYLHQADTEPIPGYRLLAPLGKGGFGEVWKCEAPGGLLKAIKFVPGSLHALGPSAPAEEELRAIQRVKSIRHPFILSMERVEVVDGELVIVLELADRSLADLFAAERSAGQPGIAREVLLAYLREAAEALDVMHVRHGLQHLDIKPQNLFLLSNHVKVGDFGLVQSLGGTAPGAGPELGAITPLYAAPEVFLGRISPHCDQYSLAIVYQELLTGTLPFTGKNARQLMLLHTQAEPDLQLLPEADRAVVARALSKVAEQRFPSCGDFVHALASGQTEVVSTVIISEPTQRAAPPDDDTRKTRTLKTIATRNLASVRPPTLPGGNRFPGLEITGLVSRTPLSEVWNAQGSDGSARLVKVLFGCGAVGDAVVRLTALRHPALLPVDVLHHAPGKLVLATPAGQRTLRDLLAAAVGCGQGGIARGMLLGYLRGVAQSLHELAEQTGLQHLALNPRNLILDGERVLLADFGLAQLVWLPAGQSVAGLNARYSAPELHHRQASPACDQYSLALIYHELLTGALPPPLPGRKGEPERFSLDRLPEGDRALVARALDADPRKRWPSPVELIAALEQLSAGERPASVVAVPASTASAPRAALAAAPEPMKLRFGTTLAADLIRQRLDGFQKQWNAGVLSADERSLVLQMQTPRSIWQRWTGQPPRLEVHLHIDQPEVDAPAGVQVRTDVRMDIRPHDCSREQSAELLKVVGPLLVESVRRHLSVQARGRQQERLTWHYPLQLCSIQPDGTLGPPVECQGKDISLNGIGFYLPGQLPSAHVMLHLPQTPQTPPAAVPARVVRVQGCGDGWYEVGAVLLPPDELPPDEEVVQERSGAA